MDIQNDSSTKQIQTVILDIFKEFKRICELHGLRYFAIGGTCLGAVRHKGFIPWDDDLDVVMPFEDYEKFRSLRNELAAPYELFDYSEHKHSKVLFLKIHNSETTFIEKVCLKYKDRYIGAFIDIMPVYGVPDDSKEKESIIKKYLRFYKLNRAQRFEIPHDSTIKAKLRWMINLPIKIFMPYNYYTKKIEKILSQYKFGNTKEIIFGWRMTRLTFDFSDFKESIELPFENTTIRVPIGYDNYLTKDFGNYMQLPPKEQRVAGHSDAVIDLNNSYKEYQKKESVK